MEKINSDYLFPYIPDIILEDRKNNQNYKQDNIIDGALLFADLSGFTAMSEKLSELGRFGGEKLAGIINDCFNSMLGVVFAQDGDIIKFGGDAFLVLFRGSNKTNNAYRCARGLIEWISANGKISTPAGDFSLDIHAGISEGKIYSLVIGDDRKEHLFCGKTVEQAYAAADAAEMGHLGFSAKAAATLKIENTVEKDSFKISKPDSNNKNDKVQAENRKDLQLYSDNDRLKKFIHRGLIEQLHYNKGKIDGEHRIITSLFIGINSLKNNLDSNIEKASELINRYFTQINDIIAKHGGYFARLDSCGDSEKMLILFGAPKCYGQDQQNCLKAAIEIELSLVELNKEFAHPIKHRYGINSGLCFVGDVGGVARREYTAMGDAINTAARLMSKSEYGAIYVGENVAKNCESIFEFEDLGTAAAKGKRDGIRIFKLIRELSDRQSSGLMIGRDEELLQASSFTQNVKDDKKQIMIISGEPGSGKSLLCSKIKELASEKNIGFAEGACYKLSEKTGYGPIKSVLMEIMGLGNKSPQKARRLSLQKRLKRISEQEWEPLIAPLLDYFPAIPPHLKNIPEETKKNKISNILCRIICDINRENKLIIIIEDIQWIDNASLDIIKLLMRFENAPGLLFISRPGEIFDSLAKSPDIQVLKLGSLTSENSRKLFMTILDGLSPSETIINEVIEKSAGNPFFLEEMAKAFKELGADRFNNTENIPTGIESVITARIDNLGEMVRKTVRTASVIGRIFGFDVLTDIFPDKKRSRKLRDYLNELDQLDLTPVERRQPVLEYIFKHILTQEVAYNGLAFSARESLHRKTAEYYASRKRFVKRRPETIARHYLLAAQEKLALPYLLLAGKKAASEFANDEAFEFFKKALETAEKYGDKKIVLETLQHRGQLAKATANYKRAEMDYLKIIELSVSNDNLKSASGRELSIIYRMTGEYKKADVIIDKLLKMMPKDMANAVFCKIGKAEIARRKGKLQPCQKLLAQALKLTLKNDISPDLAAALYNNLGICHWSLGKLNEATQYYKTALKYYRKLKDLSGQSKVINNLGIISDELGKLHHASKSYEKAEKIFKRIGASRSEAYSCANLGTNFTSRGYLTKAVEKLKNSRIIFKKIGDLHSFAYATGDLGYAYFRAGKNNEAVELITESLTRAEKLEDSELIIENKIRLFKIQLSTGKPNFSEIGDLVKSAKATSSVELEIKTRIIELSCLLVSSEIGPARDKLKKLDEMNDLNNYPELSLELDISRLILELITGEHQKSLKTLRYALKKAISKDLILAVVDLYAAGQACALIDGIPSELVKKIQASISRINVDLGDQNFKRFMANHNRTIELFRYILKNNQGHQNKLKTAKA